MLHGPNGTGKTTLARLLPIAVSGVDASIETLDGDSLLTRDDLKDYLRNSVQLAKLYGDGKHFVLLNEFDKVKSSRDDILWQAMDDLSGALVIIITTNEPMKIHRSIRSRCVDIHMPALPAQAFLSRAHEVLKSHGLTLPSAQLLHYLKTKEHAGDLRKYLDVVNELLYVHQSGLPMPPWQKTGPSFKVV